jgi:CubicO group peptidase (beta-lactamase class C family)
MANNHRARSRTQYSLTLAVLLLLLSAVSGCSNDSPTKPSVNQATLAYQLSKLTSTQHIPGAIGAIWTRDAITDIQASGIRRVGYSDKVTTHDYMHMGSLTKFMTSTMIGRLIDEGKLNWTTEPTYLFPDLAATIDSGYKDITLIDLLRHRAGVPSTEDFDSIPHLTGTLREQRAQAVHLVLSAPPKVPSGTYRYSNVGYMIAASMAEEVMNQDWRSLMTEKLFQPLGITPAYGWPIAHDPNEPWGHERSGGGFVPVDSSVDAPLEFLEPAGFLSLTLEDYSKFIRLHMDAIAGEPRMLTATTFDSLHTPVGDYACGVTVINSANGPFYWHNGSNNYFYSVLYLLPQLDLGLAITVNAGDSASWVAVGQAAETVIEPLLPK